MTKDEVLTQDRLKELLHYDKDTGIFTWKSSSGNKKKGSVAGTFHKRGYITIHISNKLFTAHRLAWLYMMGEFPAYMIDHINMQKTDNRFSNLRSVNKSTNTQNQRVPHKNNSTGFLGVHWHKTNKKYCASIKISGRCTHLGYFDTPEEAHSVYISAKRKHHNGCTI